MEKLHSSKNVVNILLGQFFSGISSHSLEHEYVLDTLKSQKRIFQMLLMKISSPPQPQSFFHYLQHIGTRGMYFLTSYHDVLLAHTKAYIKPNQTYLESQSSLSTSYLKVGLKEISPSLNLWKIRFKFLCCVSWSFSRRILNCPLLATSLMFTSHGFIL